MQRKQSRKRREYTAAELAEVWDRWERGESSKAIAAALDRGATVYYLLLRYGGMRPRMRCRSARALTLVEREEISRGIASGRSLQSIASELSRSPSTVSREIGATAAGIAIELRRPRSEPWSGRGDRSGVGWCAVPDCAGWWKRSSGRTGRRNRSPAG